MPLISNFLVIISVLVASTIGVAPAVARAEQRVALVVGNAAYEAGALKTASNDAGLVAQTLEAAGFEVMGARDLDHDALGRAFRDFLDKAAGLGSDDVAVVYLSGYGLQLEGENYFVPIDARMERVSDIPVQGIRISDYTRALAALKLKASIVVLDLSRNHPFTLQGEPLAGGLALVQPEPGTLIAFNAAPGTIAPAAEGAYGPYAKSLAEMIREGGLQLDDLFERVRLRVSDATQGAQVPWHASNVAASFVFFERTADAPPSTDVIPGFRSRSIRDLGAQEAYIAALERDTLPDYLEFLDSYSNDPLANRVRAIIAARREALIWRRTRLLDTPAAYWAYLRLYSEGPHAGDCNRRLAFLHASLEPPLDVNAIDYDIPPPLPEESTLLDQPAIFLGDPSYDFAPPPPIPESFLAPPSPEFAELPPPELPEEPYLLPTPVYIPVPVWVRPPHQVQHPAANNVIFENLHDRVDTNRGTKTFTITDHEGRTRTLPPPVPRRRPTIAGSRFTTPSNAGVARPCVAAFCRRLGSREGCQLEPVRPLEDWSGCNVKSAPVCPLLVRRRHRRSETPGGSLAMPRQHPSQSQSNPFWRDREQRRLPGVAGGSPQRLQPLAPAPRPERPKQPAQGSPKIAPPGAQAAPIVGPQQLDPQRAEWQQRQQGSQQEQSAAAARAQQQAAQQAAAARAQQQAAQQAAAARAQQQAQQPAAARAQQQQAAQQAAAARAQQQAAQQAAAARAQQQAAQQAAAARAQQQAAQQAAAARAQQQAAQQAAAARAQQAGGTASRRSPRPAAGGTASGRSPRPAAGGTASCRSSRPAAGGTASRRSSRPAAGGTASRRSPRPAAGGTASRRSSRPAAGGTASCRSSRPAAGGTAGRRSPRPAAGGTAGRRSPRPATGGAASGRSGSCISSYRRCSCPTCTGAAPLMLTSKRSSCLIQKETVACCRRP